MATQTTYGWAFMNLRWIGLFCWTLTSVIYWLFNQSQYSQGFDRRGIPTFLFLFLGATFLSVLGSENFTFSALRWLSNAMLLLNCLVFLRGLLGRVRLSEILTILKVVTFILLIISVWFPAPKTRFDGPFFRGAMGDPNSLGHVAFIAVLLFFHGTVVSSTRRWQIFQGALVIFASGILISSRARSSVMAFAMGIICLSAFYGLGRSFMTKGAVFVLLAVVLASPNTQSRIINFIQKDNQENRPASYAVLEIPDASFSFVETIFFSRQSLWNDSWEGFKERPILGWGFGLNSTSPKTWMLGGTAVRMTRDLTNDFLFILEACGVMGVVAYLALVSLIFRQFPTWQQVRRMRKNLEKRKPLPPHWSADRILLIKKSGPGEASFASPAISATKEEREPSSISADHNHAILYTLSASMLVLFQFDGSAFSPGSLISTIFWISAGAAEASRLAADARGKTDRFLLAEG